MPRSMWSLMLGSSPRVRSQFFGTRLHPTQGSVHPHWSGGNVGRSLPPSPQLGTSPHDMRGVISIQAVRTAAITVAHPHVRGVDAARRRCRRPPGANHPHLRGVNIRLWCNDSTRDGSSPQAWG